MTTLVDLTWTDSIRRFETTPSDCYTSSGPETRSFTLAYKTEKKSKVLPFSFWSLLSSRFALFPYQQLSFLHSSQSFTSYKLKRNLDESHELFDL